MSGSESAALVLMLKNPETGFFEEELGQYKIEAEDMGFVEGLCAERAEQGITVCLRVGVGNLWADDISDEVYDYIYDEYDADPLPDFITELTEIDESFNPMWEARFLFSDNPAETESMIVQALAAHKKALSLLLEAYGGIHE